MQDAVWVPTCPHMASQNAPKSGLGGVLEPLGAVLGASWAVLEAAWAVLGPSWVVLEGHLGAILGEHLWEDKGEDQDR